MMRNGLKALAVDKWRVTATSIINRLQIALFAIGALSYIFFGFTQSEQWLYVMAVLIMAAISMLVVRVAIGISSVAYSYLLLRAS